MLHGASFIRSNGNMNVRSPVGHDVRGKASKNEMDRFFSPTSLGRYRRLADDKIDATERNQVLRVLAEEWSAFVREFRMPSATCLPSSQKHIIFQDRDTK
jgi:hypothetical protein